jgi:hypothetical protein
MTKSQRVAFLRLRDDELCREGPKSDLCRSMGWRRVSRVLLAVVDIVDIAQRGSGKPQDAARDPIHVHAHQFLTLVTFNQLTTRPRPI